jgi:hypothetical protein
MKRFLNKTFPNKSATPEVRRFLLKVPPTRAFRATGSSKQPKILMRSQKTIYLYIQTYAGIATLTAFDSDLQEPVARKVFLQSKADLDD